MPALLRVALVVALALFACIAAAVYFRELFMFFSDREAYNRMRKPEISYGEESGTPVVTADRLIVSYPLLILVSGGLAIGLALQLLHDAS